MTTQKPTSKIVEAQAWVIDAHGDVNLVAQAPLGNSNNRLLQPASNCSAVTN